MSLANQVREYCYEKYILPARRANAETVQILSGDVHKALHFSNRYPLVCSALGASVFEDNYNISRVSVEGPLNGSNTLFTFQLTSRNLTEKSSKSKPFDSLLNLQNQISKFRDDRNWKQFHNPKDLAQAISIEASELLELFLWKTPEEVEEVMNSPSGREKVEDEMADIFSFLLSFADAHDVDLEKALVSKLEKNKLKYPADMVKGSAKKYDEY